MNREQKLEWDGLLSQIKPDDYKGLMAVIRLYLKQLSKTISEEGIDDRAQERSREINRFVKNLEGAYESDPTRSIAVSDDWHEQVWEEFSSRVRAWWA